MFMCHCVYVCLSVTFSVTALLVSFMLNNISICPCATLRGYKHRPTSFLAICEKINLSMSVCLSVFPSLCL